MTDDEVNKRLCELLELPFDEREGRYGHNQVNPKFQSPEGRIDLLRRMKGRIDWPKFYMETLQYYHEKAGAIAVTPWKRFILNHARDEGVSFPVDLMLDDTGALAKACLEFLEKEREK